MKKIISSLALILCALTSIAATLTPVQLINPTGSTAGQSIVSTGGSTAPGFSAVPLASGVSGILPTSKGGTGIAYFAAAGPTVARVYTFPDAAATILYSGGALGTPSSGVATNLTGTASGLTAGTVTTNANLTGPITSTGNATAVGAQTGSGSVFAMQTNPVFVGPTLGVATGTSLDGAVIGGVTPAAGSFTTLAVSGNGTFSGTGALQAPSGTTAQEPAGVAGMMRYNTTTGRFEFYGTAWRNHVRLDGDTMTGGLIVPSLNGNTITTGTGTLTLGAGKTTTFDHTSTFTTTDGVTYTFPTTSATIARTDAAQTLTGAQTYTGQSLQADGSAAAPSYAFSTHSNAGWYFNTSAASPTYAFAGVDQISYSAFQNGDQEFTSAGRLAWSSSSNPRGTPDAILLRDSAGIIAQRNGTSAQGHYLANTYTNASNYERGTIDWTTAANTLTIGAQAAGTGTLRNVNIVGANVQINGSTISPTLSGTSGSIGGGALLAGACTSGTVAVTNATTAMAVVVSPVTYPGDGFDWQAYVSSAGTVTVKVCGFVAGTPTASNYNVRVIQ